MAGLTEYKCPACGGAMEFNSKVQKMKCPYCDTELTIEEMEALTAEENKKKEENAAEASSEGVEDGKTGETEFVSDENIWANEGNEGWSESELEGMKVYSCKSCGAEIIVDKTTAATSCPYCGNQVVMKEQFSGDMKPDMLIPFKLDKAAAKEKYKSYIKGKEFIPRIFREQAHIEEIKGVYVPFWVFDVDADVAVDYTCAKTRRYKDNSFEYEEEKTYQVARGGLVTFNSVPADCSRKMDDALMESLEPYNQEEAVKFQAAYLAGYLADRYDVPVEECRTRAEERIRNSVDGIFRKTVSGYDKVQANRTTIDVKKATYKYVLYPVWLLSTTWNNKNYLFAMNGQTGKMVGDLPFDKSEYNKYVLKFGAIISAVLMVLAFVIGHL